MKIVCAWCGKEMGQYEDGGNEVSHGICDKCLAKFESENNTEDEINFHET